MNRNLHPVMQQALAPFLQGIETNHAEALAIAYEAYNEALHQPRSLEQRCAVRVWGRLLLAAMEATGAFPHRRAQIEEAIALVAEERV